MRKLSSLAVKAVLAALAAWLVVQPGVAAASPQSARLIAVGSDQLYSLDLEAAVATFRHAVAADPNDASSYRGLASALWAQVAFARGTMTVDSFLGRVTGAKVKTTPPPAELAAAFHEAVEKAATLARARLDKQPNNVDAVYEFGASIGLRASYSATIDGSIVSAFRSARAAFDAHERVLSLSPSRKDAGLIVGTYRYLVSALSMPMRWAAYIAGFGGGATEGLQLVEGAANYPGDSQTDARLALVLLYNRERRYDDALTQLTALRDRYPANRLLWLETGSTLLRARRSAEAERVLDEGLEKTAHDTRPRMFGEEPLWFLKRGAARAALGKDADAASDLRRALSTTGRDWVHGRAHLELGKLALKGGRQPEAQQELRQAITLCAGDFDPYSADEARRLLANR